MGAHTKTRVPPAGCFAFLAGEYLYKVGAAPEGELFLEVRPDLGVDQRAEMLQGALRSGWMVVTKAGHFACSADARAYYDKLAGVVHDVYIGQVAAPRDGLGALNRPPLRKAYMPNSRGIREIDPRFQRPAGFGFKTAGGGEG
ncbi:MULTISPECIES: hypothetical protein [unclassified Massilia]|uniref:hypothetical protein n=1 Tax=unclassified Massilia TaxID=2609279 RepID=UPI0017837EA1|nr:MULTISPECIES: hypothetical protein [unclassified Massilia]MBD8531536.1 hypothetical protein [Massilia sp. CFBP 13647]MBD8673668.1 hypothetical protein [Massilia sp. CFBP 13721]